MIENDAEDELEEEKVEDSFVLFFIFDIFPLVIFDQVCSCLFSLVVVKYT